MCLYCRPLLSARVGAGKIVGDGGGLHFGDHVDLRSRDAATKIGEHCHNSPQLVQVRDIILPSLPRLWARLELVCKRPLCGLNLKRVLNRRAKHARVPVGLLSGGLQMWGESGNLRL